MRHDNLHGMSLCSEISTLLARRCRCNILNWITGILEMIVGDYLSSKYFLTTLIMYIGSFYYCLFLKENCDPESGQFFECFECQRF